MTAAAPTSNAVPQTPHDYFELGMLPIPVPHKTKKCLLTEWQLLRRDTADLSQLFPQNGQRHSIGILLGASGISDVDLDCPEAVIVAPMLLPFSGWVFGRKTKPSSHWEYRTTGR